MLAERLVVIRNMEIGGAAQCLWVLCSAAVVEFGSVWWIIWTEFIVPSARTKNQKTNGSMVMLILDQVFADFKYKKNTSSICKQKSRSTKYENTFQYAVLTKYGSTSRTRTDPII